MSHLLKEITIPADAFTTAPPQVLLRVFHRLELIPSQAKYINAESHILHAAR